MGSALDTVLHHCEGLGGNWVPSKVQEKQGDLWFGTGGGVSRYNPSTALRLGGNTFTTFTRKEGPAREQVRCMLLDRSGGFCSGTEKGVSRFNKKTFTDLPIPAADLSKFPYYKYPRPINAMIQDKTANSWIGTRYGALCIFDVKRFKICGNEELNSEHVRTLLQDRAGDVRASAVGQALCS